MLGQLTGQEETDCGLDLSAGDGGLLVVVSQAGSLGGNTLEDVVDEAVHDAHGTAGDAGVGVNLLHHLVDVDAIALLSLSASLLVATGSSLGLTGLLLSLSTWLRRHDEFLVVDMKSEWYVLKSRNIYSFQYANDYPKLVYPRPP